LWGFVGARGAEGNFDGGGALKFVVEGDGIVGKGGFYGDDGQILVICVPESPADDRGAIGLGGVAEVLKGCGGVRANELGFFVDKKEFPFGDGLGAVRSVVNRTLEFYGELPGLRSPCFPKDAVFAIEGDGMLGAEADDENTGFFIENGAEDREVSAAFRDR